MFTQSNHSEDTDYTCFSILYMIIKNDMTDYRRIKYGYVKYCYYEILTIIFICTLIGITKIKYIMDFARRNYYIFKSFLELKNGIPKYDTFLRVVHNTDPEELARCRKDFLQYLKKYVESVDNKPVYFNGKKIDILALDGKKNLGSGCLAENEEPVNIVTFYNVNKYEAETEETVRKKSNEIPANLEIVKRSENLSNTVIALDALGCQKELGEEINKRNGLFLFHVKRNHKNLYDEVQFAFEYKYTNTTNKFEKNRDRFEGRYYYYSNDVNYIPSAREWPSIKAYGAVYKITTRGSGITFEPDFYIMNFDSKDLFIEVSRRYWAIENELHYIEDTAYEEDKCKVRKGNGPTVLNIIRKTGVTIFRRISEKTGKKYGTKRFVNLARNSLHDLAKLLTGKLEILY